MLLKTVDFDSKLFLNSIKLKDSYKSTQIEGTQITKDEVYYLDYIKSSDDTLEVKNLKSAIGFAYSKLLDTNKFSVELVNEIHRQLLNSVRGNNKNPGKIREIQNWIGKVGSDLSSATFIPPQPQDVRGLLENLYDYMTDKYIDPKLINVAISHVQFEAIHPYHDGNGRLGRALIPLQMALLDDSEPILYLSEIIEIYKPSYQNALLRSQKSQEYSYFIKFFLQCVIDQCHSYTRKITKINKIYKDDMENVQKLNRNCGNKVMDFIFKKVVFKKNELIDEVGISRPTANKIINELIELGILIKDDSIIKNCYRYKKIYNLFINND